MITPKVSVCCLSYNHEKYIRQCLDSIVMQQTTFPFEVLVHDDASKDNSQQIILEYAEKYPNIIKPILQKENQFSKGKGILGPFLCPKCTGKYVAFCECDDYWTDPLKLQKQVDFLETHNEYIFCCHRFTIFEENYNIYRKEYAYDLYKQGEDLEITEEIFLKVWVTQMLTTIIRTDVFLNTIQLVCDTYHTSRDVYMFYELLQQGKGVSLNQDMGIYRWNDGGIFRGANNVTRYLSGVNVYTAIYKQHPNDILLLPKIIYNYNRLLRFTYLSSEGKQRLKDAMSYCSTGTQKIKIIMMYLIHPTLFVLPYKLFEYQWRKKCSISKPS